MSKYFLDLNTINTVLSGHWPNWLIHSFAIKVCERLVHRLFINILSLQTSNFFATTICIMSLASGYAVIAFVLSQGCLTL
jgi:hypothetical protein